MKIYAETDRILLREIVLEDAAAMFEMEADPEVHRYLGSAPARTIADAIDSINFIRQQYKELGIGRWAIVDKTTNEFAGWGGLKFRTDRVNGYTNYYDVGYRLLRRFWGKGLATESAKASLKYAFEQLNVEAVYAMANVENKGSINALLKSGLKITDRITHEGILCDWFEIKREDWR
ncbi:ribosomal-protein-alanine N-acetyltransferase [Pedobacter africanus]|uniref:RimJ/RimL family protein N-acetyltransferase n=1 Tax=Pedobacter africanus TaxID=151894 RepID=A0ACC6KRV0_9SPHI|nr:GNAT family N-acetyltransferase [Pedobacter africanus]MDR6781848.1 RimJ/RimL family protein N-acetyltransferase [Pedobacter africanus]